MTALVAWAVLAYGFSTIMVYGTIFKGLRNGISEIGNAGIPVISGIFNFISGILGCPMCFSTWGGFFLGLFIYSPSHELFNTPLWISWFFDGIMSSGAVWAINSYIEWYEQNRPSKNN